VTVCEVEERMLDKSDYHMTPIRAGDLNDLNDLNDLAGASAVLTAWANGVRRAVVSTSFIPVSHEPPLLLLPLERRAAAWAVLKERRFVVSILDAEDCPGWGIDVGSADGYGIDRGLGPGVPMPWASEEPHELRVAGAVAHLGCTAWRRYDGGDQVLLLGEVEWMESVDGALRAAGRAAPPVDRLPVV
jgi:flavin reductase (DIM6/NTAB) family NADH-FMN oxidoreductase RutF